MAFEWDPAERARFDAALREHLAAVFPDARQEWIEDNRRVMLIFPDGAVCTLWEPNFFFSYPSFTLDHLFRQAAEAVAGQHQMLINKEVI